MKMGKVPGDFGFRALIKTQAGDWTLSYGYYFTKNEALEHSKAMDTEVIWPVEEQDGGIIYVPAQEEME